MRKGLQPIIPDLFINISNSRARANRRSDGVERLGAVQGRVRLTRNSRMAAMAADRAKQPAMA